MMTVSISSLPIPLLSRSPARGPLGVLKGVVALAQTGIYQRGRAADPHDERPDIHLDQPLLV